MKCRKRLGAPGSRCWLAILVEEGRLATEVLGNLVSTNLRGLPAEAKLAAGEPDTGTLHQHREDTALDDDVRHRDVLERLELVIVHLDLKVVGAILLAQVRLQRRRIRLAVALLVKRKAHGGRVELGQDCAALGALEPGPRVLLRLVNHELIQRSQGLEESRILRVIRGVIVPLKVQVNGMLGRTAGLVEGGEAKARLQGTNLELEAVPIVVQVGLLRTRIQALDGGNGNLGRIEGRRKDNGRHFKLRLYSLHRRTPHSILE